MAKKQIVHLAVTDKDVFESPDFKTEILDRGHQAVYMDLTDPQLLAYLKLEKCDGVIGQQAHRLDGASGTLKQSLKLLLIDVLNFVKWGSR